jgi:hypothetical protein
MPASSAPSRWRCLRSTLASDWCWESGQSSDLIQHVLMGRFVDFVVARPYEQSEDELDSLPQ